jgi:hypothetical protein
VLLASSDLSLDASHYCLICRSGAATRLALPRSNALNAGRTYVIKNVGAGIVTVVPDTAGGDVVEAAANFRVRRNNTVTLIADGAGAWHVIASDVRRP